MANVDNRRRRYNMGIEAKIIAFTVIVIMAMIAYELVKAKLNE